MNKVILMGRLTKDVELRYTSGNNTAVASFTLAVPRRKKDEADFINIQAWDKQAEFCSKWFHKGQQIAVVGRLQVRSWDDNEGKKRYTTEVVVEECHFAEGRKAEGTQAGGQQEGFDPLDDSELPF